MTVRYIARPGDMDWEVFDTRELRVTDTDIPADVAQAKARDYNDRQVADHVQ